MITKSVEVKSGGAVVDKIEVPTFETLPEMVDTLGEATCLELANTQNATNLKNRSRSAAVGKPTKAKIQLEAFGRVTAQEVTECAGDPIALQNLIAKYSAEIAAEQDAEDNSGAEEPVLEEAE